jgi:diguanylate cyclase (GGDEF)-like protein/PAS domain S-box-containing protein
VPSRDRFRSIFEQGPSAVIGIAPDGIVVEANEQFARLSGYKIPELIGMQTSALVPALRRNRLARRIAEVLAGEPAITYEGLLTRRDGAELIVSVDMVPIRLRGRTEGVYAILKDVTKERTHEKEFLRNQQRLRALYLVASSTVGDAAVQIRDGLELGAGACAMPYAFAVEIVGGVLTVRHRFGPSDLFPVGFTMRATQAIGGRLFGAKHAIGVEDLTAEPWGGELTLRKLPWKSYIGTSLTIDGRPYGVLAFIDVKAKSAPFDRADLEFMDAMGSMISSALARELRESELRKKAFTDPLTGVANRSLLEERLERMLGQARRKRERIALYYLDLDGFKPINDTHGHAAGDEVLREVARRLSSAARKSDVVARVGGDEFVVLVPAAGDEAQIDQTAQRLCAVTKEPIVVSGDVAIRVGVSVGTSRFPEDGDDPVQLLRIADADMYRKKPR